MKPKILSWNVRGLNDLGKYLHVKNLLRNWKADIICLQGTKLKFIDRSIVRSLWGCLHMGWVYLSSKRALGSILLLWDKRVVNLVEEYVGQHLVACSFKNVDDGYKWSLAGVYSPNVDNNRRFLWEEITGLCSWWDGPWCIGSDFNHLLSM
ncbi:hypothetical protein CIPAW_11G066600 [Carya illinoinensis]|uniref:Endonuclease/exonuclease/phosphatase domain-containing protein n=1 Tax=Carya illinoinensis TaxID=32201 RepID=A0A8T1P0I7_CARIL|nr:hypothetical protein CIPAW_11G066600 [Carya illinoinensis]